METFYDYVITSDRWVRLRERLFQVRGRRCERCSTAQVIRELALHHLTYERLGCERDEDVQLLCTVCHPQADREREAVTKQRAQDRLYEARVDGWATKRYGEDWNCERSFEDVAKEFDEWLERREEDAW